MMRSLVRVPLLLSIVALLCLVAPSCIVIDDYGDGGNLEYAITWHNNCSHDVDIWIGGERVLWSDDYNWLVSWEVASSDTSFPEGTYDATVYDHWSHALVSSGSIYIGPGSQEFVTFD